ncbi:hypothetical protein ACE01N_04180 [Saccharicrinis sp. FJH2]|uniref:hypothetical protein n=1 Tax=Saccharicrinis sp. FJH65 TaxID=3344659 RepID=UPI0035F32408
MIKNYNSRQQKIYSDYSGYSTEKLTEAINSNKYVPQISEIIQDILEERRLNTNLKSQTELASTENTDEISNINNIVSNIDTLVRLICQDEEPICKAFINWNLTERKDDTLSKAMGMIAGVAIGGAIGEMIFGGSILSKRKSYYEGQLGIIILITNQIIICHTLAPFTDTKALITNGHILHLLEKIKNKTITVKLYKTSDIEFHKINNSFSIYKKSIIDLSFNESILEVKNETCNISSLEDFINEVKRTGTRVPLDEIIKLLKNNTNPFVNCDIKEFIDDKDYMYYIYEKIILNSNRETLFKNLDILDPLVRSKIIKLVEINSRTVIKKSIILSFFVLITIFALNSLSAFNNIDELFKVLAWIGLIIGFIVSISFSIRLWKAHICKKLINQNL